MNSYVLKRRLAVLSRHPSLILRLPEGEPEVARAHIGIELNRCRHLFSECARLDLDLPSTVKRFKEDICYGNGYLYALCRTQRPKIVVETGVRKGESTAFILQALHDNGGGRLCSIDLPNVMVDGDPSNVLPGGEVTGYLVPRELANQNWTLVLGDSRDELPRLLERLGAIDMFHHDSLHTYDHMLFEFRTAWRNLNRGGILVSDDAACNSAFSDHCSESKVKGLIIGDAGIAFKESTG